MNASEGLASQLLLSQTVEVKNNSFNNLITYNGPTVTNGTNTATIRSPTLTTDLNTHSNERRFSQFASIPAQSAQPLPTQNRASKRARVRESYAAWKSVQARTGENGRLRTAGVSLLELSIANGRRDRAMAV